MNEDVRIGAARAKAEAEELIPQMMLLCQKASWAGGMTALTAMLVHMFERSPRHLGGSLTEPGLLEFMRKVTEGAVYEFRNKPRSRPN